MTELQQKVYDAIKEASTDKERSDAAIQAIAAWHMQNGNFHDGYYLQEQVAGPLKPYTLVPEPTLRERAIVAARKFYIEPRIDDDAKIEVNEEGVYVDAKVFMYHYQVLEWSDPNFSFDRS